MLARILAAYVIAVSAHAAEGAAPSPASTVGDLLRGGGTKLNKAEVVALYSGATVSGTQVGSPNTRFQVSYRSDGSMGGSYSAPTYNGTVAGHWSVDERGQFCSYFANSRAQQVLGCSFLYRQGDRYFAARTEESAEPLAERSFTR